MVLLLPDASNVWILLDLICNLNLWVLTSIKTGTIDQTSWKCCITCYSIFFFFFWARILDVTEQAVWVFGNIASD